LCGRRESKVRGAPPDVSQLSPRDIEARWLSICSQPARPDVTVGSLAGLGLFGGGASRAGFPPAPLQRRRLFFLSRKGGFILQAVPA